jgi:hypothetical protein
MKGISLLWGIIISLLPLPIGAAVVYDTGPFTADGGSMESDFSSSTIAGPTQRADDFLLKSTSQIMKVNWWGQYWPSNTPQAQDDFTLRIFGDSGGAPSPSALFQFSPGDLGRADTGIDSFGIRVYAYSALLPSPVTLQGNTTYWLSIVNNTISDIDDNWFWQRVTRFSGTVQQRATDTNLWTTFSPSTMAFNIEGVVVPQLGISSAGHLMVSAPIGSTNRIEYISDLRMTNWQTLTNVVIQLAPLELIIPEFAQAPQRFYRQVLLQ